MKRTPLHLITAASLAVALIAAAPVLAGPAPLRLDAPTHDGKIVQLNAQLLEGAQFSHRRLDAGMAVQFLEGYLESLDGSKELFLASDVDEFEKHLPGLAEATLSAGDTRLARVVFERYLERSTQRADYVEKVLGDGVFDFSGQDRYVIDREDELRPEGPEEAKALWLQRLRADVLQEKLAGKGTAELTKTLARRYRRQAETMKNLGDDAVLEIYLNALAHCYDPHSDYMGREQLESFNMSMNLSMAGIGAMLQVEGDYVEIRELVPGGPAARSGKLKAGDQIVAVAQGRDGEAVELFNYPMNQTVGLVRGPKGSEVTLTVAPAGAGEDVRETVTIVRDEIHLEDQEAKGRVVDFPSGGQTLRLGVIDLPAFYAADQGRGQSAAEDVARLIGKMKETGVRGIILDLRQNGGGSLEEAIELTGLFIPSGAVVQTRDPYGRTSVGADDDGRTLYGGPLVVLTSRYSASASEIVAGALQDYGRALVVGDSSTFGKGTVQTVLPLERIMEGQGVEPEEDPGALKVTISKFYRPGGSSTQLNGVRPDVVLPSFTDDPEISEAGMENPLEWDAVRPARYPRFGLVDAYARELRARSRERIANDANLAGWLEELARVEQNREMKSISLNEAERRRERDEATRREEEREQARLARAAGVAAPVYEITLKDVGVPGLPEPVAKEVEAPVGSVGSGWGYDVLLEETQHILSDYVRLLAPRMNPAQVTARNGGAGRLEWW